MQFVDTFNEILALSLPLLMVFVLRIDLFHFTYFIYFHFALQLYYK